MSSSVSVIDGIIGLNNVPVNRPASDSAFIALNLDELVHTWDSMISDRLSSAVAINAPVRTAPVQIHNLIYPEPAVAVCGFLKNCFCGDEFHWINPGFRFAFSLCSAHLYVIFDFLHRPVVMA
jgi:hypothetical protein